MLPIFYHPYLAKRRLQKSRDDTPTSAEVIESNTLNFRPDLIFTINLLGGTPVPVGCALGSLGQSLARIKILWRSTPKGPKYSFPKKFPLGCTFIRVNNFFVCGPKYAKFLSPNVGGVVDDQELFPFLIC